MDDQFLGPYVNIIVVILLAIIAVCSYKMAFKKEGMDPSPLGLGGGSAMNRLGSVPSGSTGPQDRLPTPNGVPSFFVGSGAQESPVFWNMGSVEETNAALLAASKQQEGMENKLTPGALAAAISGH